MSDHRPKGIDDFIGHESLVEKLKIAIKAAKKKKGPIAHTCLSGPAGTGKTSIAYILAYEMDVKPHVLTATAISKVEDISTIFRASKENDIVFIDEIHALDRKIEETLYPIMEDSRLDVKDNDKITSFELPPLTVIGATTQLGKLTKPLQDRFGILHKLSTYSTKEIAQILVRHAEKELYENKLCFTKEAIQNIAKRSRGVPRVGIRLLNRAMDYAHAKNNGELVESSVEKAMKIEQVGPTGLTTTDTQYLEVLKEKFNGGPAGLNAISSAMDESMETIANTIEPFLIQKGYIIRGKTGRRLAPDNMKG